MANRLTSRTTAAIAGAAVLVSCLLFAIFVGRAQENSRPSLPVFTDIAEKSGVTFTLESSRTTQKYLIETMPGGVAALDYDQDGHVDLYFVNGARLQDPMRPGQAPDKSDSRYWNRLYRNNGDGTFTDVTEKAGVRGHSYGMGVAVGDYDNDGYPDLDVTNFDGNILYHNNGDGTFTDVTSKAGVAGGGWSAGAVFVDYDRDGSLDLIVARYLDWDFTKSFPCGNLKASQPAYCHPDKFQRISHLVFHNNGNGTFSDVTLKSHVAAAPGKGLGVALNDFNRDGWPDVLVANDSVSQQLFRNNGDGTFTETGIQTGVAYDEDGRVFAGMGIAFDDYDNDGWPDIFISDLANQKYALFRNVKGFFEYVSSQSGVGPATVTHSGWGTGMVDYDNDGWKDLFVAQSHVMDNIEFFQSNLRYLEPLILLRNVRGRFEDVSASSGPVFRRAQAARGAAFADFENRGSMDIAISNLDGRAMLLRNSGNLNHWITINTVGVASNRDGIGARVHVVTDSGAEQYATVSTGGSYLSANDKRVHFGLGTASKIRLLEILWPSGAVQKIENLPADQILTVTEPTGKRPAKGQVSSTP